MSNNHNKKRNAGLLYEFLIQSISKALVDGDKKRSALSLKVIKRHFRKGTELHREYRLINSLVRTTVSCEAVAASIIQEAKAAARAYNVKELEREKSLLISTINHAINDDDFYDQQVNEYRIYATIQTLLNDWRSNDRDIGRMARYEDQLLRWLVTEKTEASNSFIAEESPGSSRLLMKVMMKKLNERYAGMFSDQQRNLIKAYAFATANDDPESIKKKLVEVKDRLLGEINEFMRSNSDNEYVNNKMVEAKERIERETLDVVDDDVVTRFMLYAKLNAELTTEEP